MADSKLANLLRTDNAWKGDADLAAFNQIEAQPWYKKALPMEGRATILPFRDTMQGSVFNEREFALPSIIAGAVNAFTAPERARTGSDPTFNAGEEAANFALNTFGGGVATGKAIRNPTGQGGTDISMFVGPTSKTWDANAPTMLGLDKLPRQEISDKLASLSGKKNYEDTVLDTYKAMVGAGLKKEGDEVYLKDVFNHPELYKAYPEIADYKMRILDPNGSALGNKGSDYTIGVSAYSNPSEARSTILHELQHHIQENEGFARGGSWKDFYKNLAQEHKHYDNAITRLNEQMSQASGTPKYLDLINEREQLIKEANSRGVLYPEQVRQKAAQMYNNLAGEAEARLTQARSNMTKEELAASNPYDPAYFLKSTETPIDSLIFKGNRKQLLEQEFDNLKK
jgi:hypothetical protein